MKDPIRISKTRALPADAVTQTFGIIARRGAGKTYAAGKLAEQMIGCGAPVVVLDPVGTWYGLRLAADGKAPGLPIPVLGGLHGDVELAEDAGALVAALVMDRMQSAVVDVSAFRKNQRKRFVADFAERLFEMAKKVRSPLHVIIEEAQLFAPQHHHGEERMLGAIEDIVRLGRNYGLGTTLISQRPQSVNKEVLNQVEVLLVGQLSGAHERKAIDAWVVANADGKKQLDTSSLPSLPVGTMMLWSPQWLGTFERVRIARKETFDASATPELGKRARARELAPVDAEEIRSALAATLERAKESDPKHLRAQISKLERELAKTKSASAATTTAAPAAIDPQVESALRSAHKAAAKASRTVDKITELQAAAQEALGNIADALAAVTGAERKPRDGGHEILIGRAADRVAARPAPSGAGDAARQQSKQRRRRSVSWPAFLTKAERTILTALAQHGTLSLKQAAMIGGYSHKSGGMRNATGSLRNMGYVAGGNASMTITPEGLSALGDYEELPRGPALLEHWCGELGAAERGILREVVKAFPGSLSLTEAALTLGYAPSSGGVRNAAGRLRTLQLVTGNNSAMTASDQLV